MIIASESFLSVTIDHRVDVSGQQEEEKGKRDLNSVSFNRRYK